MWTWYLIALSAITVALILVTLVYIWRTYKGAI